MNRGRINQPRINGPADTTAGISLPPLLLSHLDFGQTTLLDITTPADIADIDPDQTTLLNG